MEDKKTLIQLEKHLGTYKLVIPTEVERKIRHLCNKISNVEWSGTLFFTHSGSYEDNNLEIRCVDIFPMDIGSAGYTEFDMSPDVIAYMTDHPELLDCQMGLIHSHNNMPTFFSSTDINTLREEGNDRNHFVSLIVNNAGTYTAAVTRRLKAKKTVNTTYTYKTFDDIEKVGEDTVVVEEEKIVYNMLDVTKEGEVIGSFQEIDERLAAIRENKEKAKAVVKQPLSITDYKVGGTPGSKVGTPTYGQGNYFGQSTLFDNKYFDSEPPRTYSRSKQEPVVDYTEPGISIPASEVKSLTVQLLTGSIALVDASKIDPYRWATQMVPLFDKRFGGDLPLYSMWISVLTEFIVSNFIPEEYSGLEDEYASELCSAIYLALEKLPKNKYIEVIKEELALWMN